MPKVTTKRNGDDAFLPEKFISKIPSQTHSFSNGELEQIKHDIALIKEAIDKIIDFVEAL